MIFVPYSLGLLWVLKYLARHKQEKAFLSHIFRNLLCQFTPLLCQWCAIWHEPGHCLVVCFLTVKHDGCWCCIQCSFLPHPFDIEYYTQIIDSRNLSLMQWNLGGATFSKSCDLEMWDSWYLFYYLGGTWNLSVFQKECKNIPYSPSIKRWPLFICWPQKLVIYFWKFTCFCFCFEFELYLTQFCTVLVLYCTIHKMLKFNTDI